MLVVIGTSIHIQINEVQSLATKCSPKKEKYYEAIAACPYSFFMEFICVIFF